MNNDDEIQQFNDKLMKMIDDSNFSDIDVLKVSIPLFLSAIENLYGYNEEEAKNTIAFMTYKIRDLVHDLVTRKSKVEGVH